MDSKVNLLLEWLKAKKFEPSFEPVLGKGYFTEPIVLDTKRIFCRIRPTKCLSNEPDLDLYQALKKFQEMLLNEANLEIFALLESIITSVDYTIVTKKVKSFANRILDLVNFNPILEGKQPTNMEILIRSQQSPLETLETLFIPNIGLTARFEFVVPPSSPEIYLLFWHIRHICKRSGVKGVSLKIYEDAGKVKNQSTLFSPSLALLLDDCDVYSATDRMLDLVSSLPIPDRKVDIWVQQSIKKKFTEKFLMKAAKMKTIIQPGFKKMSEIIDANAVNPILKPYEDPDVIFVRVLTFRKIDELLAIVKRYHSIREMSFWTQNVSLPFELMKVINNCNLFTVNTINDFVLSGHHGFMTHSRMVYLFYQDSPTLFENPLPIESLLAILPDFDLSKAIKGHKDLALISSEQRFSMVASVLRSFKRKLSPAFNPFELVRLTQLQKSTFKTVSKCLMLRELNSCGVVCIHVDYIDDKKDADMHTILGFIGSNLLLGNSCVLIISSDLPEELDDYLKKFKEVFPTSFAQVIAHSPPVPYGWLYQENEVIGISHDFNFLYNLSNFSTFPSMFGIVRSIFFPTSDQISIS